MKIPETSANVGAYYGNEENGQWQGNGVMMDNGVGGGVVGSGDAGFVHHMPPHYAVRPQMHQPGYVVAGPYFPPPGSYGAAPPAAPPQDDFADYMWMENEEEFDKQVMQQLEEEALMEQCIEAMLEDEQRERNRPVSNGHTHPNAAPQSGLSLEEQVSKSTLNPLAAEFVPTFARTTSNTKVIVPEDKQTKEPTQTQDTQSTTNSTADVATRNTDTDSQDELLKATEGAPVPDTPEVSAAHVQPIGKDEKRPKETKKPAVKTEPKKATKQTVEPKTAAKIKPQVVKVDTKVQAPAKSKEVKPTKSEEKIDERVTETVVVVAPEMEVAKNQPTPVQEEPAPTIMKPINYAAAAKAKVKKTSPPPPTIEKTPSTTKVTEKISNSKLSDKTNRLEKPIQRKNSTK